MRKVQRYFLDYDFSKNDKILEIENKNPFKIILNDKKNYEINKFFYKQIGKDHFWRDRLVWTDKQWLKYSSNPLLDTWTLKDNNNDLVGYYELIINTDKNEVEIAYLGLLEEYQNKKLGSYLLSSAIKNSFLSHPSRVWVHTCSLDHRNALINYTARGMRIFKKETITI